MDKISRRHLMLSGAKNVLQQMMQLAVLILWISISSASAQERGVPVDANVIVTSADAVLIDQWPISRPGGGSGEVVMQPIIRVFRAIVKPGKNDEFQSFFLDAALPLVRSQDGLLAVTIGLPSEVSPNEFLMISVWDSLDSLRKFAGEEWSKAVIDPREAHLMQETFVHHYHQPDA